MSDERIDHPLAQDPASPVDDPGIPTLNGYRPATDPLANSGSGRSGPDNVGTTPDAPMGPPLGGLLDPASPMARIWTRELPPDSR